MRLTKKQRLDAVKNRIRELIECDGYDYTAVDYPEYIALIDLKHRLETLLNIEDSAAKTNIEGE